MWTPCDLSLAVLYWNMGKTIKCCVTSIQKKKILNWTFDKSKEAISITGVMAKHGQWYVCES